MEMSESGAMKHNCKFLGAAIVTSLLLPFMPALAQPASAQQCRTLPDAQARLLCYDAWVDAQTAAGAAPVGAAPAAVAATAMATTPAAPTSANFGLEQQARKGEIQEVESEISGLFEGWGPKQVIRLANGQVWQISDASSAVLYLKNPKVKIRRGMMGTFVLEFEASNQTARVRRLER